MSLVLGQKPPRLVPTTVTIVIDIFARVLGPDLLTAPIQPEDDFFDLGGDSALAVLVMLDIEAALAVSLPPTILFDHPTAAGIALVIDGGKAATPSDCLALKPASPDTGATRFPIFLIPGVHGVAHTLRPLAQGIPIAEPVYGLQVPGLDGAGPPLDSIAGLAAHHVATIERVHPSGAFGLIGYSMGGLVALEMARLLDARSRPPALLAVLDTLIPRRQWPRRALLRVWTQRARAHVPDLLTLDRRSILPFIRARLRSARRDFSAASADSSSALAEPLRSVYRAGRRAAETYRPARYPGRILFIEAEAGAWATYPTILWRRLAARLDIARVPGTHQTMVRQHAAAVGAAIVKATRSPDQ